MQEINFNTTWIPTPVGPLEIAARNNKLIYVEFKLESEVNTQTFTKDNELLILATSLLTKYFAGEKVSFTELYEHLGIVGTDFQQQCWQALRQIPYGDTWTYGKQASYIKKPKAVRAVGAANGKNPFAILIPCHRVIGANGNLTGYAGGLDKKKWLLEFESAV